MWPFTRRKPPAVDPLTAEVDLAPLGPFHEAERYLIVWRNGLAKSYGLAVVYQGRRGERVHVVHSPGYDHGGAMETHGEWLGTEVRLRDPKAVALFLAWPLDVSALSNPQDELIRVWFTPNPAGVASPAQTILMSEDPDGRPQVDNVFTKPGDCLYQDMHYGHPRQSPEHWAEILGCPIPTFTAVEWVTAADQVDPDRVQRAAVEQAAQDAFDGQVAFMKELGLYGESPADPTPQEQYELPEPSEAQRNRLMSRWAHQPDAATAQVSSFSIGGANLGHPVHPAPVVSIDLPTEALEQLPIDLATFQGPETAPPPQRRIRLWDETLLTVEMTGQWRLIVYLEHELLPPWWFTAAAADIVDRPHGVVILRVSAEPALNLTDPTDLLELGDGVGLAHLEDCRSL